MQAASPSPSDKQSWRKEFRRRLRQNPDPVAESAAIREHLAAELPRSPGLVIATFAALPGEPDLLPLLEEITEAVWCFPRVVGDDLCFHHVADPSELRPGAMSILEPDDSTPIIGADNFDIVLCPGLGFGRDGSRLGRGRGYYDRTLETCAESTRIIGIALSHQIEDTVPTEPHDHLMSQLACPQGILNF